MRRVREHIDDPGRIQAVALFVHQCTCVTGQRARVTGYIDNTLRIKKVHTRDHFGSATARRIEEQAIPALSDPAFSAVDLAEIRNTKRDVIESVSPGIIRSPFDKRFFAFDAQYGASLSSQRQGEVTDATKKIEHPVRRSDCQLFHRKVHHALVDIAVYLDEIYWLEFDLNLKFGQRVIERLIDHSG